MSVCVCVKERDREREIEIEARVRDRDYLLSYRIQQPLPFLSYIRFVEHELTLLYSKVSATQLTQL